MNINELIKTAHENAKANGWWDEERNTGELLMLIVSECGEALEAHRSGKRADMATYENIVVRKRIGEVECSETEEFRDHIKDTFEDELADIVIRLADYLGYVGYTPLQGDVRSVNRAPINVGEALFTVTKTVSIEMDVCLEWAIHGVFAIAGDHNIDLWRHVELKMEYNKTRGIRHGKAY